MGHRERSFAELSRQCIHHVNQDPGGLEWRTFRTDHENSHSVFDVGCSAFNVKDISGSSLARSCG